MRYLQLLSSRLTHFKAQSGSKWNMSCPFCSDTRARGYVLPARKGGGYYFYCHNCGKSVGLPWMIKEIDPGLYTEYIKELLSFQEDFKSKPNVVDSPLTTRFQAQATSEGLVKLSKLPANHAARLYVEGRVIPRAQHHRLFFTANWKDFVNKNIPGKLPEKAPREERLVFPFISPRRKLMGFQGRLIDPNVKSRIRYMTIMLDSEQPRLFGLDKVNVLEDILVLEGPIDSLFLENAIATAGGDLALEINKADLPRDKVIVVYDNEPRSPDTIKKVMKSIEQGYRVCIWPRSYEEKDVNDMIQRMVGENPRQEIIQEKCNLLRALIMENTYSGLTARVKCLDWKKCD